MMQLDTSSTPAAPPLKPRTSGLAIASLVCGIGSLCTLGLTSLPGLIMGIVAVRKVNRSAGQLRGSGMAIGGIVTSAIGMVMLLAALAIAGLWLVVQCEHRRVRVREQAVSINDSRAQSMIAMKILEDATRQFEADHDGRLPTADEFPEALERYISQGGERLVLPPDRRIAMNAAVAGMRRDAVRNPDRTVLFFETRSDGPAVGGQEDLRPLNGGDDVYIIGFADGRVDGVSPADLDRLIWNATGGFIRL